MSKTREKIEYFWMYYKWYVIIPVSILLMIVWVIRCFLGEEEMLLNVYLINSGTHSEVTEEIAGDFKRKQRLGEGQVLIDASLTIDLDNLKGTAMTGSLEKVTTDVFAHELDVMIMPEDILDYYDELGAVEKTSAVSLEGSRWEEQLGSEEPLYICVVKNSQRREAAEAFVRYMVK